MMLLKEEFQKYKTLFVGYSGGLDSTVLLHALSKTPGLREKLRAVHVHHGLSPNAFEWQAHCEAFCKALNISLIIRQVKISAVSNIEEQARKARFKIFESLMTTSDALLLGHHQDDQAETLLLHLFRGTGLDGLAAMRRVTPFQCGVLVRPLLHLTRDELKSYAILHQLKWIEDESNQDEKFSRNFLRYQIIPLLRQKWPRVVGNLSKTATYCEEAQENLRLLAEVDCPFTEVTLKVASLKALSIPRLKNVLRAWFKHHEVLSPPSHQFYRIIHEVIHAKKDATPMVRWGGVAIRRYQETLFLLKHFGNPPRAPIDWQHFPENLLLDFGAQGRWELRVKQAKVGLHIPKNARVQIRFRQGGESLVWHGQTKSLKKLWQQWQVPPWERDIIPLLYVNDELAAVVGFAVSDRSFSKMPGEVVQVQRKLMEATS